MRKLALTLAISLTVFACKSDDAIQFTEQDCEDLLALMTDIAEEIIEDEVDDEERAEKIARYTRLGSRAASKGCSFIPPLEIDTEEEEF